MIPDVGVDMMLKHGKLDMLKDGPIYWIDSADMDPCIGNTASSCDIMAHFCQS